MPFCLHNSHTNQQYQKKILQIQKVNIYILNCFYTMFIIIHTQNTDL